MSKHLEKNKNFLRLVLNTSKDQATALLHTITPGQVLLLSKIALNLSHLPLSKKAERLLEKNKKLFSNLQDKNISTSQKRDLIRKHYKHLLLTLWAVRQQLN